MAKIERSLTKVSQAQLKDIIDRHLLFREARMGGARAVLSHTDLAGLKFSGFDLSHADFTGASMVGCDLSQCKLDYAIFYITDLEGANLTNASLIRSDLRGANLRNALLVEADLTASNLCEGQIGVKTKKDGIVMMSGSGQTDFSGADLHGANLTDAKFVGAIANNALMADAILVGTDMARCSLQGAVLTGANMDGADLTAADLSGSNLTNAIMTSAKMIQTETGGATMTGVLTDKPLGKILADEGKTIDDLLRQHILWVGSSGKDGVRLDLSGYDLRSQKHLSRACLTMAKAVGAIMYGLELKSAQIQAADFTDSDLRRANAEGADLRGTKFTRSAMDGFIATNAKCSPMSISAAHTLTCDFTGCSLRYSDFRNADLRNANFTDCDLTHANFSGASMDGANFTNATLNHALIKRP